MISRTACQLAGCALLAVAVLWSSPAVLLGQGVGSKRAAVPPADAQNKVLELIRDVFKKEYDQAKTAGQKAKLAADLLQRGVQSKDATERFVLLRVARDMAALAGDAELACQAVSEMARRYEIDRGGTKKEALAKAADGATLPKQHKAVAEQASLAVAEAIARDDYAAAAELVEIALGAARKAKDSTLIAQVTAHAKEIEAAAKARAEIKQSMDVLEKDPGDPKANLAVGRYYCLLRGDWEKGLPMLALAGDQTYSPLAKKELVGPKTPGEQVALADGWWGLIANSEVTHQRQLRARAAHWYAEAVSELSGLTKMRVDKRLDEIEAATKDDDTAGPEAKPTDLATAKMIRKSRKPTFAGTWRDGFGSIIDFKVEGHAVVGTYKNYYRSRYSGESFLDYEGRIRGSLSRDGQTLSGEWARSPSYLPPDDAGTLVFKLSKNGMAFAGTFTFGPAGRPKTWTGVRIK